MIILICGSAALGVGAACFVKRSMKFLGQDEQLLVSKITEKIVKNGPGVVMLKPLEAATLRHAIALSEGQYVKLSDSVKLTQRVERGPQLLFLGPYENIIENSTGTTLTQTQYLHVSDQLTGEAKLVKGPQIWFPAPSEISSSVRNALSLQEDEYVKIKDTLTGKRWVQKGKFLLFLEPNWTLETRSACKAVTLKSYEYIRLLDTVTGKVSVHRGEQTVFPGPNEEMLDGDKMTATTLSPDEYMKITDKSTGDVRVAAGPTQVFLGPHESVLGRGATKAVQVDEEHAVLVRDKTTGQLKLITEKQLFFPGANEVVEEVRELIKLAEHEAVIIKDKEGALHFHYGSAKKNSSESPRSFFLPPHAEIMQLWWSSGLRRAKRDLCIKVFDCRSNYMWFEFDCRTQDNVELILECTFFYEVVDLAQMVATTGNLPGDIYNQARSQFIKKVASVTLKQFMETLHNIAQAIFVAEPEFYSCRGVKIHSINVTKYSCSEARTSEVLQQIIEETTDRLNRLSKAESENEVNIFRMQGQIEQEKLNKELIAIQQEHTKSEALVSGGAEAERAGAFIRGLAKDVPKLEDRIEMWQVLRKGEALSTVSAGGASLYYTPNDVDLSIQTVKKDAN